MLAVQDDSRTKDTVPTVRKKQYSRVSVVSYCITSKIHTKRDGQCTNNNNKWHTCSKPLMESLIYPSLSAHTLADLIDIILTSLPRFSPSLCPFLALLGVGLLITLTLTQYP